MPSLSYLLRRSSLVLLITMMILASSCSKKTKPDDSSLPSAVDADIVLSGDSDSGKAAGLQTISFPYDSFSLTGTNKGVLRSNSDVLKSKQSLRIQVEGHCDERGGIQYNIALGEKRANAVRGYLMDMGVSGDRITTISFGKERPLDPSSNESAWGKNRRANFVITTR